MNKAMLSILVILALTGCNDRSQADIKKGELRHTLFTECMQLAAKMPRQSDDVADIVEECGTQSYYMVAGMSK